MATHVQNLPRHRAVTIRVRRSYLAIGVAFAVAGLAVIGFLAAPSSSPQRVTEPQPVETVPAPPPPSPALPSAAPVPPLVAVTVPKQPHRVTLYRSGADMQQIYIAAYLKLDLALSLEKAGDKADALADDQLALNTLLDIQKADPRWEEELVSNTILAGRASIARLEPKK